MENESCPLPQVGNKGVEQELSLTLGDEGGSSFLGSDDESLSAAAKRTVRQFPLIPEPYRFKSRTGPGGVAPLAWQTDDFPTNGCWIPTLKTTEYRAGLSDERKAELDERASKLSRQADFNSLSNCSEWKWEADSYGLVFGGLSRDPRVRMDKRAYQFPESEKDNAKVNVRRRIPDITIGLRAYDDWELEQGFQCYIADCDHDHTPEQPHKTLSQKRIRVQLDQEQCGLIVDGDWSKTDLLFPFAIYEAKRNVGSSVHHAASQVEHAAQTYLAMIDDLARNPENVSEYQTEESGKKHVLFGFTSAAAFWKVWYITPHSGLCTLWEGSVKDWSRAYDLICLTDQIREYGVTHHREFVIRHLEPWLLKGERLDIHEQERRLEEQIRERSLCNEECDNICLEHTPADASDLKLPGGPGWRKLKEDAGTIRQEKMIEKRALARNVEKMLQKRAKRRLQ